MHKFVGTYVQGAYYWDGTLDFVVPEHCDRVQIYASMYAKAAGRTATARLWLYMSLDRPVSVVSQQFGSLKDEGFYDATNLELDPVFTTFLPGQHIYVKTRAGGPGCKDSIYRLEAFAS